MRKYHIERMDFGFLRQAIELVESVFMEFEAPGYSDQGIEEFHKYIQIERLQNEMVSSRLMMWGCFLDKKLVGVLGIETKGHICLLFVAKELHRQGIAKTLLKEGLLLFRDKNFSQITVNSSPYAVPAYQRMGFAVTQPEQDVNGIRFTPMVLSLV